MSAVEVQSFLSESDNELYNVALELTVHQDEADGRERAFLQLKQEDMPHYQV